MKRSTCSGQPFRTAVRSRRRGRGPATAPAVAMLPPPARSWKGRDYSLIETVAKSSAVSGLGVRPCTFSDTASAGGECEIGRPGR